MNKNNPYVQKILLLLSEQKEKALREYNSTDLNNSKQYNQMHIWFECIKSYIQKNPPIYPVKQLNIYENNSGDVLRIEYKYCSETEKEDNIAICIYADLY